MTVIAALVPLLLSLQAVSIVGDEVFSFKLSLFPGATEADGYSDMSKVDGKVTMRLGCIQIIYLHQFLMSLLVGKTHTNTHWTCVVLNFVFVEFASRFINWKKMAPGCQAGRLRLYVTSVSAMFGVCYKGYRLSVGL